VKKLLTAHQISTLLQISVRTLYEWTHIGFAPHYKLPKGVRFKMSEVEKQLKERKNKGKVGYKIQIDNVI